MASANGRSKRWARILLMLAMDGPLNPYKTWAKLIKEDLATQPTIRGDLEELLKRSLVKNVDTDRKARGGRPSKHYDLTLAGLMHLIASLDDNEKGHGLLNDIARKYQQLMPSVFDVWPAILKAGVGDIAFRRLQEICMSELEAQMVRTDSTDLEAHKVHESFFAIETYHDDKSDDRARWFRGLMLDRTLRDRMAASIRHQINYLEYCLKSFEDGKRNAEKILEAITRKDAEN